MTGTCDRSDCAVHYDLPCELGYRDFSECPHYRAAASAVADSTTTIPLSAIEQEGAGQRVPWSGRALGLADMPVVAARGPAQLIGLIGPFNAGKTSFLTSMFTHFATNGTVSGSDFAGSVTLNGWDQLRKYTSWPAPHGGMFPPHTPDNGQRVPSLLHLAFRRLDGTLQDVLFTDAPGEWFTRWMRNQESSEAQGARWIAENATHFLFVIDREGLANNKEVGRVRESTLSLARILGEQLKGRPMIAIWTKSNTTVNLDTEAPIRTRLMQLLGPHASFDVHVEDPSCIDVLATLLRDPLRTVAERSEALPHSAFLAYGLTP